MRKISSLVVVFVAILAGPARPADEPKTALPENIKIIFSRRCGVSGCHQGRFPAGNLNFEPDKLLSAAINTPSQDVPGKKIIDTSTPEKSYLLAKIKGEPGIVGARMPAYRDPLSAEEIKAIEAWIMSLKPGNSGGGNGHDPQAEKGQPTATRKQAIGKPAFWGTRIVNLPTAETIDKGKFLFRISHRFGLGGRVLVFDDFSVIAEWVPVLAGYKDYINGWGLGVEKKIGGHVFQVFISNCYGLAAPQYLIGGDLGQFETGFLDQFRLGFNIFRIL